MEILNVLFYFLPEDMKPAQYSCVTHLISMAKNFVFPIVNFKFLVKVFVTGSTQAGLELVSAEKN